MRAKTAWLLQVFLCGIVVMPGPAQVPESLRDSYGAYTSCGLPGGPDVVETAPLAPGIQERTVRTIRGTAEVPMVSGRRIMFAYPGEDFYLNLKVELLPAEHYAESKEALKGNFDYLLASGDNNRNYALKPKLNGFDISGLDRMRREGGVLGVYLLFDDSSHMVMTMYFLNQEPAMRFQTMEEYANLRDRFLTQYTACVRSKLSSAK